MARRRHNVECASLPESPWSYFTRPRGTILVPIAELKPIRARPSGIVNARKHMEAACAGGTKRAPISISHDGRVLDGNSTYAVAVESGWSSIPALVERETNSPRPIRRSDYPSVFDDSDADTIPDVDDPRPFQAGDEKSIEEVQLSDEIGHFIDTRQEFLPAMQTVIDRLQGLRIKGAKVQGRVKTPFSIVNKLRRKRLDTLTDIAGTRIVVPDEAGLRKATSAIEEDFPVLEKVDYYKTPQQGYRAMHYIVSVDGRPVEVQVKTRRMAEISKASHTPYKRGVLDVESMDRLTELAAEADAGNEKAMSEIDPLLRNSSALRRALTIDNPRLHRAARRLANGCF